MFKDRTLIQPKQELSNSNTVMITDNTLNKLKSIQTKEEYEQFTLERCNNLNPYFEEHEM